MVIINKITPIIIAYFNISVLLSLLFMDTGVVVANVICVGVVVELNICGCKVTGSCFSSVSVKTPKFIKHFFISLFSFI